MIKVM